MPRASVLGRSAYLLVQLPRANAVCLDLQVHLLVITQLLGACPRLGVLELCVGELAGSHTTRYRKRIEYRYRTVCRIQRYPVERMIFELLIVYQVVRTHRESGQPEQ